jgi:hypothetical protein
MKPGTTSSVLIKMVNQKHLRKLLAKKIDNYIYKSVVDDNSDDLQQVRLKKYQFFSAMLYCVLKSVDKGYISKEVIRKIKS